MPFTIPEQKDIPDGSYPAVLENVSEAPGQFGTQRRWTWLIEVGQEIIPHTTLTSGNTGPRSTSYGFLKALIGRDPQPGETIADPTGTRVLVTITHNDKGYPKVSAVSPFQQPQMSAAMEGVPR